jgi:beta-xylosidase
MHRFRLTVYCLSLVFLDLGTVSSAWAWRSDQGNGTYANPPLYADYPDPDIIRVGEDFYFATSTFVNAPALRLLHSKDLVNWEILGHVGARLDGRPEYDMQGGVAYRYGIFAPSLRYNRGVFYIVVTPVTQNTRVYYSADPRGPWKFNELDRAAFDPGFFIDTDGTGYIATSGAWDGTIKLLTLNADFTKVVDSRQIYFIKGAEGCKLIKRGSWYYLFNAIPSRLGMTVSRSKSLFGKWETIDSINDQTGGHQGAIVDLPDGAWYGFVMKDCGSIGRMTNISPVFWDNDWPVWGTPDAPGWVPDRASKPIAGYPVGQPATSDEFDSHELGMQWAWNHNPDDSRWSLTERPGYLRLTSAEATGFWTARNTLTQKGQGPWSRAAVRLDLRNLKPGDICGFGTLGKFNGHIAVTCDANGKLFLGMNLIESTTEGPKTETRVASVPINTTSIFLRTDMDFKANHAVGSWSTDGAIWSPMGGEFPLAFDWRTGTFQGQQYAIFCYRLQPGVAGHVDVDWFRFSDEPVPQAHMPARHR